MSVIPIIGDVLEVLLANPLLAWLVLIAVFAGDSWLAAYAKFEGSAGWIATQAVQFVTGNHALVITSFQMLVLIVILPVCALALQHSARVNRQG